MCLQNFDEACQPLILRFLFRNGSGNLIIPCFSRIVPLHQPIITFLVFSLVLSVGAVVLFQQGTFLIGGQRAAILSTFEPVTSLAVGFFVFQETISFRLLAGAALVIAAAVMIAVYDMLEQRR